jgi:hypothetical protein
MPPEIRRDPVGPEKLTEQRVAVVPDPAERKAHIGVADIHVVHHHDAAGAHEAGETVQGSGRIRKVLEDEPADQCVEPLGSAGIGQLDIFETHDVSEAPRRGAVPRRPHRERIPLNADNPARRSRPR